MTESVQIEWLAPDGRGAGRGPEGLVRVRGAIVGDIVQPRVVARRGRSADAEIDRLITPSADRRTPPCPWDARCGGCDLSAFEPIPRRVALAKMVAHTLGLDGPPPLEPSPRSTGHRARIKLAIDGGVVGYRGHRSHELAPIDRCAVARPELQALLDRVRALDPQVLSLARTVELRSDGARAVAAFEGSAAPAAEALASLDHVAWNGQPLQGQPTLELRVQGHQLRAGPRSFFQVNLEANEQLVGHVVEQVAALQPERVLDLYAGIGNLTLPLAATTGVGVHGVEMPGPSLDDLEHNAGASGLAITREAARVERWDPASWPFDVAVLDPPRAGAAKVLPRLLTLRPRAVVYVSCDIRSARRDLREVASSGYRLSNVRCFDLFPDTHHVETVLVLERP